MSTCDLALRPGKVKSLSEVILTVLQFDLLFNLHLTFCSIFNLAMPGYSEFGSLYFCSCHFKGFNCSQSSTKHNLSFSPQLAGADRQRILVCESTLCLRGSSLMEVPYSASAMTLEAETWLSMASLAGRVVTEGTVQRQMQPDHCLCAGHALGRCWGSSRRMFISANPITKPT